MAVRSVVVNIGGNVTGLIAATRAGAAAVTDMGRQAVDAGGKSKKEFQTLGTVAGVAGAAIGVGVGLAVKSFMDFDKAMSGVKAVSNATTGEMDRLREAALKAGADTAFSATEAAQAEAELAKVGISTADILGGALKGSLDLAAAGQLDLAEAATISGQAMKIFGLSGRDVGHVADLLAAGANKSAADVKQLGDSLRQGGLVAAQAGLSIEDTVGVLAMFSDNALIGSDAGTSLKTMLMQLMNPSKESAKLMEELGINAYDASGRFVGLEALAGQLQSRLGGLTQEQRDQALAQIFGSDAMRAASVLYKEGVSGVQEYTAAVNDQGAAGRMAATQMDNLAGDLEQLKGSLETALIQSGSAANGTLRGLTQAATGTVNVFNGLPPVVQKSTLVIGGISAAALLAASGLLFLLPKIAETKAALDVLGLSAARTSAALGTVGRVAGAVVPVLGAVSLGYFSLKSASEQGKAKIDEHTKSMVAGLDTYTKTGQANKDLARSMQLATSSSDQLKQGLHDGSVKLAGPDGLNAQIKSLDSALAAYASSGHATDAARVFDEISQAAQKNGQSIDTVNKIFPQYRAAAAGAKDETKQFGQASGDAAGSVEDQANAIKGLIEQIDALGNRLLAQRGDERAYQAAIDDATASIKENGRSLNINTEAGRANQAALDRIASSANAVSKNLIENGSSHAVVAARARGAQVAFENTAVSMGMARSEARRLAAQLITIPARTKVDLVAEKKDLESKIVAAKKSIASVPKSKQTKILADIAAAQARLAQINRQLNALDGRTATTTVTTRYVRVGTGPARASMGATGGLYEDGQFTRRGPKYAVGGAVSGLVVGPGTGTSDEVRAPWLSNGEFVQRSVAVQHYGLDFMDDINNLRFPREMAGAKFMQPAAGGGVSAPIDIRIRVEDQSGRLIEQKLISHSRDVGRPVIIDARTGR